MIIIGLLWESLIKISFIEKESVMISKASVLRTVCLILMLALFMPGTVGIVNAEETKEQNKVRIGYMIYDGYQNGGEGEVKSGSAYEYYQRIKYYTNWEYEYVYGSISDIFEMLENGEIDIMSCVTYSEERAEKYYFSDESHGSETYFLYTHLDNSDITPANFASLNGKRVGVTLDSYQEKFFREWCETNEIDCNIITYTYMEDLYTALTNKEVDAIVATRVDTSENEVIPWKSLYRFKSEPLYFAVNKARPDILKQLNDAQAYIVSTDEYYGYAAMQKYHDGVNYYNSYLTKGQQNYLKSLGKIKVGYLEGTNPLSFTDSSTGQMSGLCAEYLDIMSDSYGVEFETYAYLDENSLIEDLLSEKVDIIFPMGMGYWAAEELGIALSASICNQPMTAIYLNIGGKDTFETVAVNKNSPTQEGYATQYYPDAEIYYVENTKEALKAIEDGLVDVYFVRSSGLEFMDQKYKVYNRFRTMSVRHDMEAFMATRIQDTALSIILDKGISLMADAQRDSAKFRYTYDLGKLSLWQAVEDNLGLVIGITVIIILLCVMIIVLLRLQSNKAYMKMLMTERDKAEKAEQAKTDFLSQMSHDIRTPMNAIIGFTNFIKEESNLETIKEDYVPKIEVASNHLLMLINDVLEMSRIDAGKLIFQRGIHDIEAIIDSVVTVMRMQAEEKGLSLTTDISVTNRVVNCDQHHLSRVIMNLLSNAVKFTPSGGKVTISVHQQPKAPQGYATYEIKVSDTGIGMEPEFIERVFDPFERERSSTVSGMQGTGLGLAIVKRIVDTAGDTISVESAPGKGTTFTFNVKLMLGDAKLEEIANEKKKSEAPYSLEELKDYFKGRRILLVEDNEFNSTIAYVMLENAGFLVETADNGQIAVEKVMHAPVPDYYDIVLMDIQMPVMDGYEATKAIRALADDRAKVKIIAVTANAFETDKEQAKEAGMDGHVSKPIDVNMLYQTLMNITN